MNTIFKIRIESRLLLLSGFIILLALFIMSISFVPPQTKWTAPESAKDLKNPIPSDAASLAAGKTVYLKECLQCHGKKGLGDGPNSSTLDKAPAPLNDPDVKAQTDGELFWKIKEGKKPMPSTKTTLTDDQRWQVVNYVRTLAK
jgi:mono/diheme cytochrome c family protein